MTRTLYRVTKALREAHNMIGTLAGSLSQIEYACNHMEVSPNLAEILDDPGAGVAALNNLAPARGAGGDLEGAFELAEAALGSCASHGDRHREGRFTRIRRTRCMRTTAHMTR